MTRYTTVLGCAALVAASVPAWAGDKEAAYDEMINISHAIQDLRANGGSANQIGSLMQRYAILQQRMGGDDPANLASDDSGAQAWNPSTNSQVQHLVAPICPGIDIAPPVTFPGQPGPILDVATVSYQCPVGGVDDFLWDIDLTVAIQHTFAADMDIRLISPAGTVLPVSTDNGGGFDDVFNGTLFDDNANDPVTDHVYANLVVAPVLSPEGRFAAYRGEDPNGIWTLEIVDDAGGDVGNLNFWQLDVTTVNGPEGSTTTTIMNSPGLPIVDNQTTSSVTPVAGLGLTLEKVVLYMEVTHTFGADLDMRLMSPAGTIVAVSTDNGGGFDNTYNGTTFDPDVLDTVTDHIYANLVTATPLSPEGSFDNFVGQDPNGPWTLSIFDDAGGDIGTLVRWDLTVTTCAPALPMSYCTTGLTTNGCLPEIWATTQPSLTFADSCIITVSNVEGAKQGLIFYGVIGPSMISWNGVSFLCVKTPLQRTPAQSTGGTAGLCNGTMVLDWDLYQQTHPTALGNPWALGNKAWVQGWFRDPPAPKTTNLSDGLEITYRP